MKIRLKKNIKQQIAETYLVEEAENNNSQAEAQQPENTLAAEETLEFPNADKALNHLQFVDSDGNEIITDDSDIDEEIEAEAAEQNMLVDIVKLPSGLFAPVLLPAVGSNVLTLLLDMGNAKKFKDMRGMMPDPTNTINSTPDYAKAAFADVEFQLTNTPDNISDEPNKELSEDDNDSTKMTNTSESILFNGNALNEGIFDHFIEAFNMNHNKDIAGTDKNKSTSLKNSGITSADGAIDRYLSSLKSNTRGLLKIMGANKPDAFFTAVISETNSCIKDINEYIKNNLQELENQRKSNNNSVDISKAMLAIAEIDNAIGNINLCINNASSTINDINKVKSLKDELLKIKKNKNIDLKKSAIIEFVKQNGSAINMSIKDLEIYNISESALISSNNHLNEEEEENKKNLEFSNFEEYYNNIKQKLELTMSSIISSINLSETAEARTAKTQMEALKTRASSSINTRIDQICKVGSTQVTLNQGVGQKVAAFLKKHPMRAEKLKDIWAGHEQDLNDRINQRMNAITNVDNRGALGFCFELAENTIPELYAKMLTYKLIITFFKHKEIYITQEKLEIPNGVKETVKNINTKTYIDDILAALANKGSNLIITDTPDAFIEKNDKGEYTVNSGINTLPLIYNMANGQADIVAIQNTATTINNNETSADNVAANIIEAIKKYWKNVDWNNIFVDLIDLLESVKTDDIKSCIDAIKAVRDLQDIEEKQFVWCVALANKRIKDASNINDVSVEEYDADKEKIEKNDLDGVLGVWIGYVKNVKIKYAGDLINNSDVIVTCYHILGQSATYTNFSDLCKLISKIFLIIAANYKKADTKLLNNSELIKILAAYQNMTSSESDINTVNQCLETLGINKKIDESIDLAAFKANLSDKLSKDVTLDDIIKNNILLQGNINIQSLAALIDNVDPTKVEYNFNDTFTEEDAKKFEKQLLSIIQKIISTIRVSINYKETENDKKIKEMFLPFKKMLTDIARLSDEIDKIDDNKLSPTEKFAVLTVIVDAIDPDDAGVNNIVDQIMEPDSTEENIISWLHNELASEETKTKFIDDYSEGGKSRAKLDKINKFYEDILNVDLNNAAKGK